MIQQKTLIREVDEFQIDYNALPLQPINIFKTLGYDQDNVPIFVMDMVIELLAEAHKHMEIRAGFEIFPISRLDSLKKHIVVHDVVFNMDKIIFGQLRKSENLVLFILTVGKKFGDWSDSHNSNGDPLVSYIIDMIGSETAELAGDLLEEEIGARIKDTGLKLTNRFSPGYCDWHVSEQHKMFSLLPEKFCGISLNPSGLMIPLKSISGVIGVGHSVRKLDYQCSICSMENCYKRKNFNIDK